MGIANGYIFDVSLFRKIPYAVEDYDQLGLKVRATINLLLAPNHDDPSTDYFVVMFDHNDIENVCSLHPIELLDKSFLRHVSGPSE